MEGCMEITQIINDISIESLQNMEDIEDFHCGNNLMDIFIQGNFKYSIEHHYCCAYKVVYKEEIIAIFALNFDSLDLDSNDKEELRDGFSSTGIPNISIDYSDTFYAKPRFPALEITYLAVSEKWRGKSIGSYIIKEIADRARSQTFAGCQFLTVEALMTDEYKAAEFYSKCGFTLAEIKKPYKDTVRMFMTLYARQFDDDYEN